MISCVLFYFLEIRGSASRSKASTTEIGENPTTAEVIVDGGLYLRTAPSVEGKVITALKKGDKLKVLEKGKGRRWYKVETEAGEVGWVKNDAPAGPALAFTEVGE